MKVASFLIKITNVPAKVVKISSGYIQKQIRKWFGSFSISA